MQRNRDYDLLITVAALAVVVCVVLLAVTLAIGRPLLPVA